MIPVGIGGWALASSGAHPPIPTSAKLSATILHFELEFSMVPLPSSPLDPGGEGYSLDPDGPDLVNDPLGAGGAYYPDPGWTELDKQEDKFPWIKEGYIRELTPNYGAGGAGGFGGAVAWPVGRGGTTSQEGLPLHQLQPGQGFTLIPELPQGTFEPLDLAEVDQLLKGVILGFKELAPCFDTLVPGLGKCMWDLWSTYVRVVGSNDSQKCKDAYAYINSEETNEALRNIIFICKDLRNSRDPHLWAEVIMHELAHICGGTEIDLQILLALCKGRAPDILAILESIARNPKHSTKIGYDHLGRARLFMGAWFVFDLQTMRFWHASGTSTLTGLPDLKDFLRSIRPVRWRIVERNPPLVKWVQPFGLWRPGKGARR